MLSTIKIPIQDLTPAFIAELKEKYGAANLEITVQPDAVAGLSEAQFWSIIDKLDWEKAISAEIVAPAIAELTNYSVAQIYDFEDQLTDKLRTLDQEKYATQIGKKAYGTENYFSVDTFLYVRACVIANGKAAYEEVLENPTAMPKDVTFEPLLSLAAQAYKQKTGNEFEYLPTMSYETFANEEGWTKA